MEEELKAIATLAALVLVVGCNKQPDTPLSIKDASSIAECRVQITRIGVFKDDSAYNNKRSVYIITDSKTGKEYIGVSGVGISEVVERAPGKPETRYEK